MAKAPEDDPSLRTAGEGEHRGRSGQPADEANDPSDAESLRLSELLRPPLVRLALKGSDQWAVVRELIGVLVEGEELPFELAEKALQATREREAIRPTGWKYGLALPNGRVSGLRMIVAAVGLALGGVEFGCRDGMPARLVVLLLFPEARYARFSPAINEIADTLADPSVREAIFAARTPDDVIEAIEDAETRDFS
jgi:mannitol/fructose-specific phosphotransferase system IIA component (Ntr-type)